MTDVTKHCPYIAEHKVPNKGEFRDGRRTTTIPRFALGGKGTIDENGNAAVTFRCLLGHEWTVTTASSAVRRT